MTQRVLIVGGSDFIGLRLAERLLRNEVHVTLADRRVGHCPAAMHPTAANLGAAAELKPLVAAADVVVNCVAGTAAHMLSSAHALFSAAQASSRRIVLLSTMAAYGSLEGHVTEESPLLGDVDDYAAARAQVDRMAEQYGAVRFRPGIIYGPGSTRWSWQVARLLVARRLGDLGALGDGHCNLLYIDDLTQILAHATLTPLSDGGAYNLRGRECITWNEYFVQYARALHAVPVRRVTGRRLKIETKIVAPPLKIASMLMRSAGNKWLPEMLSPSMLRVCSQDIQLNADKANTHLAPTWTPLEVGLNNAADWFKQRAAR